MKIPDKEKEPWSYHKWKELDLLKATDIERIIMLELHDMETTKCWLFGKEEPDWDFKDMRKWVRHIAKRIEREILK